MANEFAVYKRTLLEQHAIRFPDQRPLYRYRLSDEQFTALESLLQGKVRKYLSHVQLGDVACNVIDFPGLFVLYASEWWRRRYDGTGWSWEPILRALGAPADGWNQAQRSQCVSKGLQDWNLKLNGNAGYRYLGTIALQGGLPMRLLAEAHGALGNVLVQVLKLASGGASIVDIKGWVASLGGLLPRTYRQDEIYTLLAEVIVTVLQLKEEAKLTDAETAIASLNQKIPNWRDRFPLPVEAEQAQGLIEKLIKGVIAVPAIRSSLILPVARTLEQTGPSSWQVQSSIELPSSIGSTNLARLFNLDEQELPGSGALTLSAGSVSQQVSLRKMFGHGSFRIERQPWVVNGLGATAEHTLTLSAANGSTWYTTASRGDLLDDDLPWVFEDTGNRLSFARQGSGAVAAIEAVIAVPSGSRVTHDDDSSSCNIGRLSESGRALYKVRGTALIEVGGEALFRIRTGQANAKEEHFEWKGPPRIWERFVKPDVAFKGTPSLFVVRGDGVAERAQGTVAWRALGGAPLAAPRGPVEGRYPATGPIQHRAQMVVLPERADIRFEFGDSSNGKVRFVDWGAIAVESATPEVELNFQTENGDLRILLESKNPVPPEWFELDVLWPTSTRKVRVRLPYPVEGVRVFDHRNREIQNNALLAVNQLAGLRLLALLGDGFPRLALKFELKAGDGKERTIERFIHPASGTLHSEIRLQDYAEDIQRLLTTSEEQDAYVLTSLRINNTTGIKLRISRYACLLERAGPSIQLDAQGMVLADHETLSALSVRATRLDAADEEPILLMSIASEGVATGSWAFNPDEREAGAWLIYPEERSSLPFRPTLWTVPGDTFYRTRLEEAIRKADLDERVSALDAVISSIAEDYLAPDWNGFEQLVAQVGHLPLQALDVWRRFAHSVSAMAALALRFGPVTHEFILRFGSELPFMWELVPYQAWRKAITMVLGQCVQQFGDETGRLVAVSHLNSRIDGLSGRYPAITNMLHVAKAEALGETQREIAMFSNPQSAAIFSAMLFDGGESMVQRLMQNHTDETWPTGFQSLTAWSRNDPDVAKLLSPEPLGFRDSVVSLPIILATRVMNNLTSEWLHSSEHIYLLREHQSFDQDWFTEAYNYTVARCLGLGLVQEPQ
ncbi:MAG: hypothetical protein GJU73_12140 [Ferrovum sp.]|jgi:hypothetical protein|uniref:STY4851/ECs_5259 family protein n=1 Tax=Ferrovum sp. TaxID=2609467 RepID=UPI00261BFBFA|nr:STY4851/ECs_5259 family protein [Ferrovum sp.]MBW8068176.1 hypothetical protein [Ferrovum sp.]